MRAPLRKQLGALGERQFRLLLIGQAASGIGNGMVAVALSFAVLDLTGSVTDLGFVFAAETIPFLGFLLVGGVVADRLPRRRLMLTADTARLVTQTAIAVLLLTGEARIWQLVVTEAVYGTAAAFFGPAATGLIPTVISAKRLQQANALRGLVLWIAFVVGPALGGAVVAVASPGWAFAVQACGFGVSATTLARLRLPQHEWLPARRFLHDLREGWREVVSRDWIVAVLVFSGIANMALGGVFILLAYVSKASLGGAGSFALIASALGLGGVLGGLVALRVQPRRPLVVGISGWLLAPLVPAVVALGAPAIGIAAGGLVTGFGVAVFYPLWETTLQRQIPPRALSRVSAYDLVAATALAPVGQMLIGPLAAWIGINATLWVAAAVILAGAVTALSVPGVRKLESGQPDA